MKRHRLLLYQVMSRRMRGIVTLLLIVLTVTGLYDQFNPILGDRWYIWWFAVLAIWLLWIYYVFLMRRAYVTLRANSIRLQGPVGRLTIHYARIHAATSAQFSQHYPADTLHSHERRLLDHLYGKTTIFVELSSVPRAYRFRRLWFPRILFGTQHTGLLLLVEDWMSLSQDIDVARDKWRERKAARSRADEGSIVTRILNV